MAEKRLPGEGEFVEPLGQFDLRLGVKGISDVPELVRLVCRGFDECRMAMPEHAPAKPGEEIEIPLAVGVVHPGAFAALHHDGKTGVVSHEDASATIDDLLGSGHRG